MTTEEYQQVKRIGDALYIIAAILVFFKQEYMEAKAKGDIQ